MNESELLLKTAVEEIVTGINRGGMAPHDATVKVARELDLNPNFIKRASEVINVALHYNHFKKNAAARAEDFPIVDAVKVAEDIFGKQEKTANEIRSEWFPTAEYDQKGANIERWLNDPQFKQAYETIINSPEGHTKFAMSVRGVFDKTSNYIRDLEKNAEEANTKLAETQFRYNEKFCGLLNHFASKEAAYRTSFDEFESQVFSKYGERVTPYLDLLHKTAGITDNRGVHDKDYKFFDTCKEAQMFDQFITASQEFIQAEQAVKIAEENYKFEKDYVQSAYSEYGQAFAPKQASDSIVEQLEQEIKEAEDIEDPVLKVAMQKQATPGAGFLGSLRSGASGMIMDKMKSESVPGSRVMQNSPHDNLERQLILQELLTTDDHLSRKNPQDVAKAYEQMMHVSPELAKEKEIARATLRQMMEAQGFGAHEAGQLIDTNHNLMKLRQTQESPKPAGGAPQGKK